jgi:glycerol-3-phosphate dehydrogenase
VDVKVRREDVSAAWSGIRPLVVHDTSAKDTASMSRDHYIEEKDGLITIVGGKWTTYRKMAQDVVTKAIEVGKLQPTNECRTKNLTLIGGKNWDDALFTVLIQDYKRMKTSKNSTQLVKISSDIAQHLSHSYGTRYL